MFQLMQWALALAPSGSATTSASRPGRVCLLYSCRTRADVLMLDDIHAFAAAHPEAFSAQITLSRAAAAAEEDKEVAGSTGTCPPNVRFGTGRISVDSVASLLHDLPAGLAVERVVISGPDGMMATARAAVTQVLKQQAAAASKDGVAGAGGDEEEIGARIVELEA